MLPIKTESGFSLGGSKGIAGPLFHCMTNNFEMEGFLSFLFFLIAAHGRARRNPKNDPTNIAGFLDTIASDRWIKGVGGEEEKDILGEWIRATLISVGKSGKSLAQSKDIIRHLVPLSFAVYKSGIPQQSGMSRRADEFIYALLVREWALLKDSDSEVLESGEAGRKVDGQEPWFQLRHASKANRSFSELKELFHRAVGKGISLHGSTAADTSYDVTINTRDGVPRDCDIQELLMLLYLRGFQVPQVESGTGKKKGRLETVKPPALPGAAFQIARDIIGLVLGHSQAERSGHSMPAGMLLRRLKVLIGLELFVYTVRLHAATNLLVTERDIPPGMSADEKVGGPEIYVDLIGQKGHRSTEMARACVQRDLESLSRFYRNKALFKAAEEFRNLPGVDRKEEEKSLLGRSDGMPELLLSMLKDTESGDFRIWAQMRFDEIKQFNQETLHNTEQEVEEYFNEIWESSQKDPTEALVRVFTEGTINRRQLESDKKWFKDIAGRGKPYGVMVGSGPAPKSATLRYFMSDELLGALVELAFVPALFPGISLKDVRPRKSIALREFLDFLECRFGILIGRPPSTHGDSMDRRAARENLEALKGRLRQMGFYRMLSDDLNTQRLTAPEAWHSHHA